MNSYNPKRPRPTPQPTSEAQVDGLLGPAPEEVIDIQDNQPASTAVTNEATADATTRNAPTDEVVPAIEDVSGMDFPTAGQVAVAEPPKGKIIATIAASGLGLSAAIVAIWWWIAKRQRNDS